MEKIESKGGFESPPQRNKRDGSSRLVGFELEFSGVSLDDTVAALRSALGGRLLSVTAAEQVVELVDAVLQGLAGRLARGSRLRRCRRGSGYPESAVQRNEKGTGRGLEHDAHLCAEVGTPMTLRGRSS